MMMLDTSSDGFPDATASMVLAGSRRVNDVSIGANLPAIDTALPSRSYMLPSTSILLESNTMEYVTKCPSYIL